MIFSILLVAAQGAWFGPATVDRAIPTSGNPFDPAVNDVRCVFTHGGHRYERFAYYAHGEWHATFAGPYGGPYQARFTVNGTPVQGSANLTLQSSSAAEFVRASGKRFKLSSGAPYVPLGHDFGWQSGPSYPQQLADMHAAGLNWTRIWSDSWDGKNPYVPQDLETKLDLGRMYEPALDRWDMIVKECEKDDIKFQFVLFHHGLFTTFSDSNWATHPWNKANGGFLESPIDFFSDPTAKKLSKAWLRYAVARWGHSPAIMAWELFNEVQWTNAARDPNRIGDVIAWHKEMGDYLRSIDPNHHLVTSSSSETLDPRVFATMDYLQPHTYPPSVYGAILGTPAPADRPLFFGEFGAPSDQGPTEYMVVRDGIWGGILAGQAGPGQYWYWDRCYNHNLYSEYARETKIVSQTGFAQNPDAAPAPIKVTGAPPSDLLVRPGRGWGSTDKFVYNLPEDGGTGALPQLSSFFQGNSHREMMREPIRLRFNASKPGRVTVHVAVIAKSGGSITVSVNGSSATSREWPAGAGDTSLSENLTAAFPIGQDEVVIENPGADWVQIDSIKIEGVGSGVSAACLGTTRYALARLTWTSGFGSYAKSVSLPSLQDGSYEMKQFDLDAGMWKTTSVRLQGGRLENYAPYGNDEVIVLTSKSP